VGISAISYQQSIKCGETKEGNRQANESVIFTFNALNDYDQVYLEGCKSTHDIVLEIKDSTGHLIKSQDDQPPNQPRQNGGECENRFAPDITIPGYVKRGQQYTFVVKGYRQRHGDYSVTLVCETLTYPDEIPSTTPFPTQLPTSFPTSYQDDDEECSRIRKPWHLLSESERQLFINGFRELKKIGKLDYFTQTHADRGIDKHNNAGFLPWHRYFIWELETQFRNLGGDYKCFGLPYWDWSYDIAQHEYNVADWQILNSGLGGAGNKDNNYCVDNDGWDSYTPYNNDNDVNCLRRKICGESGEISCAFWGGGGQASALHSLLSDEYNYGDDDDKDYRYWLETKHGAAHVRIGGPQDKGGGHLGSTSTATHDPIFYLIHSFVDFQYSLWQDCRDHELVSNDDITSNMYDGHIYKLDDDLDFGILSYQEWTDIKHNPVTVRDMHSIEDWNVIYDKGDYFERATVENDESICQDKINPLWFKDITTSRRRLKDASDNEEYSRDVFNKISAKYGCHKSSTSDKKTELYKTWAQMDCQFLTIGNNCARPKYFDDCSDIERDRYVEGTGQFDIDITLEELKSKVADYPCMVETREMYYSWAKQVGNLKGLARGDYDTFCDHGFISKQPAEKECAANQIKKKENKHKRKGSYDKW